MFAELWIYMGLAWLSLFFSWNVNMVVEAHKVLKKRRQRNRYFYNEEPQPEDKDKPGESPTVIDIFNFPKEEDYSTVIKEIGAKAHKIKTDNINRSKSCSDIQATNIQTLDHSPKHRRLISISEVFMNPQAVVSKGEHKDGRSLMKDHNREAEPAEGARTGNEEWNTCDSENDKIFFLLPAKDATEEKRMLQPDGGGSRFKIYKVEEEDLTKTDQMKSMDEDDRG